MRLPIRRIVSSRRNWSADGMLPLQDVRALESRIAGENISEESTCAGALEEFQNLAADLEALWTDPQADERTKKRLLRTLIREIVVDIDENTSEVVLLIHWRSGVHTPLRLPRRRRGQSSSHTPKDLVDAVRVLSRIYSDDMIAGVLNRAKLSTARGNYWARALGL